VRPLLWIAVISLVHGQATVEPRVKPKPKEDDRPIRADLRVDTTMVLVPVEVSDGSGRPVTGLEQRDFRVFDDKIPQTISSFAMEDGPIAVGVVFDRSGSMATGIPLSRRTVSEFFKSANPEDEFFLVEFASAPKLIVPLAADNGSDIQEKVGYSKPQGSTAMFDAVYMALNEIKHTKKQRKALLLITDGGDNNSRYTETEVKNAVRETDVMIYTIGVGADYNEERMLKGLSERTGGRYFTAGFQDLPDVAEKVGIDLRNRYILGYVPTNKDRDGRYHRVEIKMVPPPGLPPLKASWRRGYYAAAE